MLQKRECPKASSELCSVKLNQQMQLTSSFFCTVQCKNNSIPKIAPEHMTTARIISSDGSSGHIWRLNNHFFSLYATSDVSTQMQAANMTRDVTKLEFDNV
jgi:hypothetical protein